MTINIILINNFPHRLCTCEHWAHTITHLILSSGCFTFIEGACNLFFTPLFILGKEHTIITLSNKWKCTWKSNVQFYQLPINLIVMLKSHLNRQENNIVFIWNVYIPQYCQWAWLHRHMNYPAICHWKLNIGKCSFEQYCILWRSRIKIHLLYK